VSYGYGYSGSLAVPSGRGGAASGGAGGAGGASGASSGAQRTALTGIVNKQAVGELCRLLLIAAQQAADATAAAEASAAAGAAADVADDADDAAPAGGAGAAGAAGACSCAFAPLRCACVAHKSRPCGLLSVHSAGGPAAPAREPSPDTAALMCDEFDAVVAPPAPPLRRVLPPFSHLISFSAIYTQAPHMLAFHALRPARLALTLRFAHPHRASHAAAPPPALRKRQRRRRQLPLRTHPTRHRSAAC
jgi:hypothetical protein